MASKTPKYQVRYNTGMYGSWDCDIVRCGERVPVVSSIYDKDYPYSPYAAQRVAERLCTEMNAAQEEVAA